MIRRTTTHTHTIKKKGRKTETREIEIKPCQKQKLNSSLEQKYVFYYCKSIALFVPYGSLVVVVVPSVYFGYYNVFPNKTEKTVEKRCKLFYSILNYVWMAKRKFYAKYIKRENVKRQTTTLYFVLYSNKFIYICHAVAPVRSVHLLFSGYRASQLELQFVSGSRNYTENIWTRRLHKGRLFCHGFYPVLVFIRGSFISKEILQLAEFILIIKVKHAAVCIGGGHNLMDSPGQCVCTYSFRLQLLGLMPHSRIQFNCHMHNCEPGRV